jgi:hypothetical protein
MEPRPRAILLAAASALTLSACQRDEVAHYRVPKEQPPAAALGGSPGGATSPPPGMAGDVPAPPRPSGEGALTWTLPRTWTETRGGNAMRFATLKPPVEGRIDVSVTVLPGEAGGELANVNRWRGQIGLPPLDQAALAGARRAVATKAGEVSLYDFTSEGQARSRIIAGLASAGGNAWFLKMTGDERAVGAARQDFIRIVESLRLAEAD